MRPFPITGENDSRKNWENTFIWVLLCFFWLLPYVGKGIKGVERPKKADKIGANKSLQQLARVKAR